MIYKHTASIPIVWDCDNDVNPTAKQLSASSKEIVAIKLVASAAAATVFLYDTNKGEDIPANLVWVMDSSTTATDNDDFPGPLTFKKGIYAVLTQGSNNRPILCLAVIPNQPLP